MNELVKFWAVIASLSLALYGAGSANFQLGTVDTELDRNRDADAKQWTRLNQLSVQVAKLEVKCK